MLENKEIDQASFQSECLMDSSTLQVLKILALGATKDCHINWPTLKVEAFSSFGFQKTLHFSVSTPHTSVLCFVGMFPSRMLSGTQKRGCGL